MGENCSWCASVEANNEVSDCELMNLTKRAQYLENILETFWNIWKNDYLTSIRQFHQRRGISKGGIEAKINDMKRTTSTALVDGQNCRTCGIQIWTSPRR